MAAILPTGILRMAAASEDDAAPRPTPGQPSPSPLGLTSGETRAASRANADRGPRLGAAGRPSTCSNAPDPGALRTGQRRGVGRTHQPLDFASRPLAVLDAFQAGRRRSAPGGSQTLRCLFQASGPSPSISASLSPVGCRLSRGASKMSSAKQVSGRSRQTYASVTPSCSARSVINLACPLSILRRQRCARTSGLDQRLVAAWNLAQWAEWMPRKKF
jgi:hypothetical protein